VQDAPTTNDHDCRDAEPTKHTQPFTTGKGFGVRDREFALFFINKLFLQTEFSVFFTDKFHLSDVNQRYGNTAQKQTAKFVHNTALEMKTIY